MKIFTRKLLQCIVGFRIEVFTKIFIISNYVKVFSRKCLNSVFWMLYTKVSDFTFCSDQNKIVFWNKLRRSRIIYFQFSQNKLIHFMNGKFSVSFLWNFCKIFWLLYPNDDRTHSFFLPSILREMSQFHIVNDCAKIF